MVELASNDGYLLKNFVVVQIFRVWVLSQLEVLRMRPKPWHIPVLRQFFTRKLGEELSQRGQQADLIIGNNVYAHVPDINDFTSGMKASPETRRRYHPRISSLDAACRKAN
ncbi:MAG: hypothetical protein R3D29_06150 [Nitratireductor sp.]